MRLGEIANYLNCECVGDESLEITAISDLSSGGPGTLSFLSKSSFRPHLESTNVSAVILRAEDLPACPVSALITDNPYLAYARVSSLLHPVRLPAAGVSPAAYIDPSVHVPPSVSIGPGAVVSAGVVLGEHVVIGPQCVLEEGVHIGADSRLVANVTICHACVLGERVVVHPGAVIGSDGFGMANDQGRWVKIQQIGAVRIGNDVEIGANTTIDRGAIEDTLLADGVQIDNLVQIAHNVSIGEHTAVAGCAGIAGSATIGRYCTLAGGVGVVGQPTLADGVHVTAMSMVTHSISEPGVYSSGTPLQTNREWHRNTVRFKRLDDLTRRVGRLEKQSLPHSSAPRPPANVGQGAGGPISGDSVLDSFEIKEIMQLLPHRYPFLLVDRVVELEVGKRLVALKNVTINEPFFQGHFPVKPVMPGVLIIEALAQATGLLAMKTDREQVNENTLYYFVGIDKARFKRPVDPGDQIRLEVDLIKEKRGIWVFDAKALVDGAVVATAEIMCTAKEI